jgi:hypothetical protein
MAEDITKPNALDAPENDPGTGIYWFIDSNGRYEQVFIPSITRKRAIDLATDFDVAGRQTLDAYRWVPDRVANVASLTSSRCSGTCQRDIDCIDNACKCINGECRRKS